MLHILRGNILLQKGLIVQGCNTLGMMGSGLALDVRKTYPKAFTVYKEYFDKNGLSLGLVIPVKVAEDVIIVNGMTQATVKSDPNDKRVHVNYEALRTVFEKVVMLAKKHQMPIHFPKIGAGLANGDWDIIWGIIADVVPNEIQAYYWDYVK